MVKDQKETQVIAKWHFQQKMAMEDRDRRGFGIDVPDLFQASDRSLDDFYGFYVFA